MDAYVFAGSATEGAVSTLAGGVGQGGPARAVCPLSGDRALYVAISADTQNSLTAKIADVLDTSGLASTNTYIVLDLVEGMFSPTYGTTSSYVGFSVLTGTSVTAIAEDAAEVSGVIGVAVVNGSLPARVLVESTASSTGALATIMANVEGISGATLVFEATGVTSQGTGM